MATDHSTRDDDETTEPMHPADRALALLLQTEPQVRRLRRKCNRLGRWVRFMLKAGKGHGPLDAYLATFRELWRLIELRRELYAVAFADLG